MKLFALWMFIHSFFRLPLVQGELTCVVLECVSNQDTVRLQWLVPLQVNLVRVPLNPKVLWSSWLYERNIKAIRFLLFVTNITYLMLRHGKCYTTKSRAWWILPPSLVWNSTMLLCGPSCSLLATTMYILYLLYGKSSVRMPEGCSAVVKKPLCNFVLFTLRPLMRLASRQ